MNKGVSGPARQDLLMKRWAIAGPFAVALGAAVIVLLFGCSQDAAWPPPLEGDTGDGWTGRSLKGVSTPVFEPHIDGWQHVKSAEGEAIGWGPDIVDGEALLPVNIFTIDQMPDVRINNLFVVKDYGRDYTLVALNRDEGHRLCMAYRGISAEGILIETTAIFPGTRARIGDRIFELKPDGWYLGDTLVHHVTAVPPNR